MGNQFIVVRSSYANASIYIECEDCWMTHINESERISMHCVSLDEAREMARKLDEEGVNGSRAQNLDCAHAKAE
jgi:hypothetical protein